MWRNGRKIINCLFKRRTKCNDVRSKLESRDEANSDRSDIRVFEVGVSSQRYGDYEHGTRNSAQQAEGERLIAIAKEAGLFIDKQQWESFGDRKRLPSGESIVYLDNTGTRITKIRDPFAKSAIKQLHAQDVIYEHLVHNIFFPSTKYKFEGISQDIDDVRIVLSQNYLSKSFLVPSQKEIDHYLVCELNLVRENNYFYGNDYVSITDVSAQGDNVLSNGKQLFFIDPIIKFNRPAIEVLDYYYSLLI